MKIYSANSSQRAFTLIELMIAMLIGVFLIAGVIQIFLSAKQAYRLQENLSRLQENGRFAMDIITKDIRSAGFMGCSKILPTAQDAPTITELTKVNGNNSIANNWTSTAWNANPNKGTTGPCGASNECIVGTDAISLQFAKSCGGQLTTNMATASANVQIGANSCGISAGDQLLIADCTASNVFLAKTGSTSTSIIPNSALITPTGTPKTYNTNAELFSFQSVSYFIRAGASGVPSLYRVDNTKAVSGSTNPIELVEGIENMQILYGVDTEIGTANCPTPVPPATAPAGCYVPNYYVDANTVTANNNWDKVVSIRINLLAVTIDNNLTDTPQPYFYNNATTNPPQISVVTTDTSQLCPPSSTTCQLVDDRRIHRVFSSTIAVRNRLP
jgi:type IV pilus assembly protein PilW